MNPHLLRIVLIDDHEMFREGVAALIARDPDLDVIAHGSTSDEAVALARDLVPDVLILDVELGGASARTTIAKIRREAPATNIVVLTMHRDSLLRTELLRAGAVDYVTKSVPAEQLLQAIHRSASSVGVDATPPRARPLVSERQHDVLVLMAQAKSNKAIAAEMNIAEGTVKRHASAIFEKLQVRTRMDAVQRARLLGIIS